MRKNIDPACGSGSFLVGMLHVLDDLQARAHQQLGIQERPYDRKKRIIGQSLYGVDVKDWAAHVAELRLWLQLMIETDISPHELQLQPLLPNLSFKVRTGDSLVQEVGGINLALRQGSREIPPPLKGEITRLQGKKLQYFHSRGDLQHNGEAQLRREELRIYRRILDDRLRSNVPRLQELNQVIEAQRGLFGDDAPRTPEVEEARREREPLECEQERLNVARAALKDIQDVPFVWDIAFVEVFAGDKSGFDIIVGNPPYVRQEAICDPRLPTDEVTRENKRGYKKKLAHAVYGAWPRAFGYNWQSAPPETKLSAKSDLYIYFYLYGLSLLNPMGSFCFITSNAWLDVGYGSGLQRFLLTRGRVKLVLDNEQRRSFSSADVNTVIVLLGAAQDGRGERPESLQHIARFVMFRVPFDEALDPVIWEEIEEATARYATPEFRVVPLSQAALLESGRGEGGRYAGEKWGGRYLRAPDIYWTLLQKGQGKLVRLGDVAEVRYGIKTGANEFFYLDEARIAQWGIEEEFLVPVIRSPRECPGIVVDPARLGLRLFLCSLTKDELCRTAAAEYIDWGESQGYHSGPTCGSRVRWWDLGVRTYAPVNASYLVNTVMRFFYASPAVAVSDNFQEVHPNVDPIGLLIACNSTVSQLLVNTIGRSNFGEGLLKIQTYELRELLIPDPASLLDHSLLEWGRTTLLELDESRRAGLDEIVFDTLDLTQGERDGVYEALIRLVEARLQKAGSV